MAHQTSVVPFPPSVVSIPSHRIKLFPAPSPWCHPALASEPRQINYIYILYNIVTLGKYRVSPVLGRT